MHAAVGIIITVVRRTPQIALEPVLATAYGRIAYAETARPQYPKPTSVAADRLRALLRRVVSPGADADALLDME